MPVDRDTRALLPVNMLDWVPEDHVVRLVIDTVEAVATPELTARLVPAVRSRRGRRRYDPVMLLTLLAYSYLRGVLSSRAIEDRCRYDVTFRVACGKLVPDHVTIARFRKLACSQDGLMEELFYAVLRVCAAAGLGRLTVVAGDGVKIGANASKEANRTEAGLRKLAAAILAGAAAGDEPGGGGRGGLSAGRASGRAGPIRGRGLGGCGRAGGFRRPAGGGGGAAGAGAGLAGRAGRGAAGDEAAGLRGSRRGADRPGAGGGPASGAGRWWDRKRAAGGRAGKKPVPVEASRRVARQRERLARAEAAAARQQEEQDQAGGGEPDGTGKKKDKPRPVRNVTDPDSALMPVRGGGLKQGYNCQDAAADDRLMLGGFASAMRRDTVHAARLEAVAVKGAQVVAARTPIPATTWPAPRPDVHRGRCRRSRPRHHRLPRPDDRGDRRDGEDADTALRLISPPGAGGPADRHRQPRQHGQGRRQNPAAGPPPEDATATEKMDDRLRTPQGRAAYKRRAPDIEGVHASIEDLIGLRRSLPARPGPGHRAFLLARLCHNLLLLSRLP